MPNVKRGDNRYVVITAVTSGNMTAAFAALGNTILFYKKATTTPNGISATQSYSNDNPFPSYSVASVGDIISIAGLTDEVSIPVLGEANVGIIGTDNTYSDFQNFTASTGQIDFLLSGTPPANIALYEVWINGVKNLNGDNGFAFSVSGLSGSSRTITVTPGPEEGNQDYKIRWKIA